MDFLPQNKEIPQRSMKYYQIFSDRPLFYRYSENYVCDKHLHKEIELLYVRRGFQIVNINNQAILVKERQTLIISDNVLHQYTHNPKSEICILKFLPEWMTPRFLSVSEQDSIHAFLKNISLINPAETIDQSFEELVRADPEDPFSAFNIYTQAIRILLCMMETRELVEISYPTEFKSTTYLDETLQYVQDHCLEEFSLKQLSDHLGLTESYCSRYFKNRFGVSFTEYLSALRINYAQRLLIYTNESITEICLKSGFSSIQTFNRVFKNLSGMSPTQYRSAGSV